MKKMLHGSLIALIAVVGSANATSITIKATHPVAVYVSYGNQTEGFKQVDAQNPLTINTGALSQDKSKINTIIWVDKSKDSTMAYETGAKFDIPRVLAGGIFAIGDDGNFAYNFNVRGSGKGRAEIVTPVEVDDTDLRGDSAEGVKGALKNAITKKGTTYNLN